VIFSFILIVLGSYLAYFKIVPLAINFLTNPYFVPQNVGFLLNYQTNIFYVLSFILWAVLALQTPLLMEILLVLNVLQRKQVLRASRYIIVGIFILAAIITPPDFISQLGVALPLLFFYFLALLIAKIFKFGEG
jgi:sec-independent protein translocase protein TatC